MQDLEQKQFQKRQISYKTMIYSILNGNFAKGDSSAGYVKINGVDVSRVNVMANLVYKTEGTNYSSAIIDDGSGKISLRSFENISPFAKIDVGDAILVIGKVREFNEEKYLVPEIIKKIDNIAWIKVRRFELKGYINQKTEINGVESDIFEEDVLGNDIYQLIKKLDRGEGVSIEDLVNNHKNYDVEKIVDRLLQNGDVFEINPGRIKVLE